MAVAAEAETVEPSTHRRAAECGDGSGSGSVGRDSGTGRVAVELRSMAMAAAVDPCILTR